MYVRHTPVIWCSFFFSFFWKRRFILVPLVSAHGAVMGMCVFQEYVCTLHGAPHGIPNISIPVDVFDAFETTQHTLEHDSKHGRGSPSAEQRCTSPLRSVWRVYKPNPPGHAVSWDPLLLCCIDWLHVARCVALHHNSNSRPRKTKQQNWNGRQTKRRDAKTWTCDKLWHPLNWLSDPAALDGTIYPVLMFSMCFIPGKSLVCVSCLHPRGN